eukprot:TRINITY_DN84410_c0_g1_i2.p1 TRINITY_DN84410_c0_g1~~TRINITY_DN84410_c0_g1_i2.p1  ORF type:complete len:427 (+),score=38.76 TRINITY_DN84410_c0_g1_i2:53-1333(+)
MRAVRQEKGAEVYIGVDFGTSGCRAACIDDEQLLSESSVSYPGNAQPEDWKVALQEVLQGIPERTRASRICINGTSSTVLLCNDDGEILAGPLMYNYACGDAAVQRARAIIPSPQHVAGAPTSTLPKAFELLHSTEQTSNAHLLHQSDWLSSLLHGHVDITDYHNALKLGFDVEALEWPSWLTKQADLARVLPRRVLTPGEEVANVSTQAADWSGLPTSCMVVAGTTDSIAAFLAAETSEPGEAVTSLGSTLAVKMRSLTRVDDAQFGIYSHRLGSQWLVGGASNSGGAVLRQLFGDSRVAELSEKINPEESSGLDYYPLCKPGERFPICDPNLPACLQPRPDDDAKFLHGVLEGMSRIEAQGYGLLAKMGAGQVKNVTTAGGGSKNEVWRRMRERYLKVPVTAASWTEAACGSALLAREGKDIVG